MSEYVVVVQYLHNKERTMPATKPPEVAAVIDRMKAEILSDIAIAAKIVACEGDRVWVV